VSDAIVSSKGPEKEWRHAPERRIGLADIRPPTVREANQNLCRSGMTAGTGDGGLYNIVDVAGGSGRVT